MVPAASPLARFARRLCVAAGLASAGYLVSPAPAPIQAGNARAAASPPPAGQQIAPSPRKDSVALRRDHLPGPYPVDVLKVLDGDTFEARVRVWFGQEITTLVRLRGIDAPELKARCGEELRGAEAARDALAGILGQGRVNLRDVALDKYGGRVVASIFVDQPEGVAPLDVARAMLAARMARPYSGGRRDNWCPLPPVARG
jgi:endonuclease YncB( thermonuclease family)